MLSEQTYHQRVPKDLQTNLRFRRFILGKAREDAEVQQALRAACAQDLIFWINTFVWQYNPNARNEVAPFITWDWQDKAFLGDEQTHGILEAIHDRRDLVIEKSRDMGASWMCLLTMVWMSLFHQRKKFLCVSRNADAVDKPEDPDSLFWKIDFILDHLPDWMVQRPKLVRQKMVFSFKATGSSITGQASTGKAGVGGRCTAMFVDEFAQIAEDQEVLHRTADTTRCRIFNSTHVSNTTAFFQLTQRPDIRKLVIHWSQHPDKRKGLYRYDPEANQIEVLDPNHDFGVDFKFVYEYKPTGGPFPGLRSPWYDEQCVRRASQRAVAMDLDIDPMGSMSQFFDPALIRSLQEAYCRPPVWEGDVFYERDTATFVEFVRRDNGPLKLWVHLTTQGLPPMGLYGAGADIAVGTGATPSCLAIANAMTGEKVLQYTNAIIGPEEFALVCVVLCKVFRTPSGVGAMFAWEMAGPGLSFGKKVVELGYTKVWHKKDDFDKKVIRSTKPGWYPVPAAKRLLLEEYRSALSRRLFVNRDWQALDECNSIIYTPKGTIEHAAVAHQSSSLDPTEASVNHADHVIGDALCWKMIKPFQDRPEEEQQERSIRVGSLAWRRQLAEDRERQEYEA